MQLFFVLLTIAVCPQPRSRVAVESAVLLNDLMGITHLPSGLLNDPERQELVSDSSLARNNASGIVFKVQDHSCPVVQFPYRRNCL
jgi:hypothetical protein